MTGAVNNNRPYQWAGQCSLWIGRPWHCPLTCPWLTISNYCPPNYPERLIKPWHVTLLPHPSPSCSPAKVVVMVISHGGPSGTMGEVSGGLNTCIGRHGWLSAAYCCGENYLLRWEMPEWTGMLGHGHKGWGLTRRGRALDEQWLPWKLLSAPPPPTPTPRGGGALTVWVWVPTAKLQPPLFYSPLFSWYPRTALEISIRPKWEFSEGLLLAYVTFHQIIVFKGFKNKFESIQFLNDVGYWMQITLTAPLSYNIIRGQPPFF